MRVILINIFFTLTVFGQTVQSQDVGKSDYDKNKEKILNVVINSIPFDSIYSYQRVYWASNELLSISSGLKLKRGKCKAKILSRDELIDSSIPYVSLGDFTIPREQAESARVQIYSSSTKKLLTLRIVKIEDNWMIEAHKIFDD